MNEIRGFALLAHRRIEAAMARGEFDNLPGAGAPLTSLDDDAYVPSELRLAYRILKNSGFVPESVALRRTLATLEDKLTRLQDAEQRRRVEAQVACLKVRLELQTST